MNARTITWSVAVLSLAIVSSVGAQPVSPAPDVATPASAPAPAASRVAQPKPNALPPAEIVASVSSAGFKPLSRPVQRGAVYYVFARDSYLMDVRVAVDARSGRVLSATRVAGTSYGGPGYESYGRRYEPAPVPPGEIPLQQPRRPSGPAALEARRRPAERPGESAPLPRARPDEVVTGDVKEAPPRVRPDAPAANPPAEKPPAADPAAAAGSAKPQPAPPQPPIMVPVAPLE
jgi:hypothetical protein